MAQRFVPNFNYSDPSIGHGVSNLAGALFGDPTLAATNELHRAQTEHARSATAVNNLKVSEDARLGGARSRIASTIATLSDPAVMADPARRQAALADVHTTAVGAGVDPDYTAKHIRSFISNTGGDESAVAAAAVGAGGGPRGIDQAYTTPQQETFRRDDERMKTETQGRTIAGENSRNAATNATSRANNADSITAAQTRQDTHPLNTPANTTTTLLSPAQVAANGGKSTIEGAPTTQSVVGRAMQAVVDGKANPEQQRLFEHNADPNPDKGRMSFNNLDELDSEIDAQTGVAIDKKTGDIREGSEKPLIPEVKTAIRQRAAQLYEGKEKLNPASAVARAIQEVGGGKGFEPNPDGPSSFFGSPKTRRVAKTPAGNVAGTPPAGAPQATGVDAIPDGGTVLQGGVTYKKVNGQMVPVS